MIAVVQIGGHQAIVKEGEQVEIDKINEKEGSSIELETLLVSQEDGTDFEIGTPFLDGKKVTAKVLAHGKADKIRVFKMKPRKRYRRVQGHRQETTLIEIGKIGTASPKTEKPKVAEEKKEAPKKTTASVKKTTPKTASKADK